MAEAAAGAVVEEVVKCAVPPIKRGFNYLCCFTSNINNLKHEAEDLEAAEKGIRMQVDTDVNGGRVIHPQVDKWFTDTKIIRDEKTAILEQVPNVGSVCLNLCDRFSLSKRATKTAESMEKLRGEGKFDVISLPGPPVAREAVSLRDADEFDSRKKIEEDIMAVLRSGDVSMIGICGMGGLGKTTMAKRVKNRVLKEGIFKEAVFAVVSQPLDKPKIQLDIAGQLGLNLKDEPSEAVRTRNLHKRLSGTKKILLVLDDVWERVELEEFGIPCDSKGCTILITSRNKDTLSKMDVKDFGMEILSDEDARMLFRKKAGACMDDLKVKSIAEEIMNKCGGLPIALATVGAVLKDKKDPGVWSNALFELSRRVPSHIDDYTANVYNHLRLSYDFLSSEQDKSMFLLCCLFHEDANIGVEELLCFGVGLGIFEGIQDLEDARGSVSASIMKLKDRSLLLDSEEGGDYVRMHDIVRDVCIFIAREKGHVEGNHCSWISSFEQLGEGTKLPNLNLLFLSCPQWEEAPKLDNTIFEWISDLRVLCIKNYSSFTSLPSTHSLQNIKSLVLFSCGGLETLSAIGGFINLEILICLNCSLIKELPLEIKRLNGLKLLDISGCENLQTISQGIISSLCGLEELKMIESFNKWESKDREERVNAGLRELEKLINLRCLEIVIEDPALAAEKIQLSSKIKRFDIKIGTKREFFDHRYKKIMFLELEREEPCSVNSISMQFLRDTEYLNLEGSGANSMDLEKCQNIRWLELAACETITSMVDDATALQASIEHLILYDLPKLEGICEGAISSNSFHNLKELKLHRLPALKQFWKSSRIPPLLTNLSSIYIEGCDMLCNLGDLSMAGEDCLPQLEELVIKECEKMEQVFLWNKNRNDSGSQNDHCIIKVFLKLKKIELCDLPNLTTFYQGMGGFEIPLLMKLFIEECPKLKNLSLGFLAAPKLDHFDSDFEHNLESEVSFDSLKKMEISRIKKPLSFHKFFNKLKEIRACGGSMSCLFTSSMARRLDSLEVLIIERCYKLVKVIEDEENEEKVGSGTAERTLLFPKLNTLHFDKLPNLVSFCEWKCDVELPSLRDVKIGSCPVLSMGSIAVAPILNSVFQQLEYIITVNVSDGNLKVLCIKHQWNPFCDHKTPLSLFNGLEYIVLRGLHGSTSLLSSSVARNLVNLRVLIINQCYEMVKVIEDKKEEEEKVVSGAVGMPRILFPVLEKLELEDLPKLVAFCDWKCDVKLPSLKEATILRCPAVENFNLGFATAPELDCFKTDFKHNLETGVKVSFDSLKKLILSEIEKPLHGHNIFNGLKEIEVCYSSMTYLFTSSMARCLDSLQVLIIKQCNKIVKVIEDEENEEKVGSGGERSTLLFPKLRKLELEYLPKLESFCEWKCDIEFPSLRDVDILDCPVLRIFTMGSIAAAPNLERFEFYQEYIFKEIYDLNIVVQEYMTLTE